WSLLPTDIKRIKKKYWRQRSSDDGPIRLAKVKLEGTTTFGTAPSLVQEGKHFSSIHVNRVIHKPNLFHQFLRQIHQEPPPKILYPLESRKLLKVAGSDAAEFLQGLITNDMRHFEEGTKSMYAMFLNNRGRVLYDTLIHKYDNSFMIECDKNVLSLLHRHLKLYKLKRKVEIGDVNNNLKVWAFIAPPEIEADPQSNINLYKDPRLSDIGYNINIYKDPRLENLGYRILSHASLNEDTMANVVGKEVTIEKCEKGYKHLRYTLGVSEGACDLPPGTSFPLEANCDYLHGVSFHKGCYIGQELTARVHHTGVVRKRIMPLKFSEEVANLEVDSVISASGNPKSNLGKLKGFVGNYGLGLVRIKEALEAKGLIIGKYALEDSKTKEEAVQIVYDFKCSNCNLNEKAHYKGQKPPFSRNIVLRHPSYVMKDPFSPPGKGEILVIGSDCAICDKPVCISKDCSLFYIKSYCLDCANKHYETFPVEIK
ncbi:hypothetical protein OBRU01_10720, partial [Operophtera brumata]